jgi:hypothetical protein
MRAAFGCAKRNRVRPLISAIYDELVARYREAMRIDLDDIAEVIGSRGVTYEEVEYLIDRLETEGFAVGEGIEASDVEIMQLVLTQARSLQQSLGRRPTVEEIASSCGKPTYVVRRALERASGKLQTKAG